MQDAIEAASDDGYELFDLLHREGEVVTRIFRFPPVNRVEEDIQMYILSMNDLIDIGEDCHRDLEEKANLVRKIYSEICK